MSTTTDQTPGTFIQRFRKARRKRIKRWGKNFIRGMAAFLGRQSLVGDAPVLDKSLFPYLKPLEDNWQVIRAELDEILKHREAVPLFHELSQDQKKISKGPNWRTFILYGFGERSEKNCARAPETARLLAQVPNIQTAWFSILSPRFHIPAHRGVTKGIVRCHLGLIVPKDAKNCTIRIDDQIVQWKEGEAFVFDDTYDHEVHNNTEDDRVVLLFDFDRPMRFWGRVLNKTFVSLLKLTAYYQEPKKKMQSFEERFEAATRRAEANLESLSDAS
jgi:aspartyl/asparaginyl beta-hydroxylase (cupin superfamily)